MKTFNFHPVETKTISDKFAAVGILQVLLMFFFKVLLTSLLKLIQTKYFKIIDSFCGFICLSVWENSHLIINGIQFSFVGLWQGYLDVVNRHTVTETEQSQ